MDISEFPLCTGKKTAITSDFFNLASQNDWDKQMIKMEIQTWLKVMVNITAKEKI